MEREAKDLLSKRLKLSMEDNEKVERDGTALEIIEKEEAETNTLGSEEMQMNIAQIMEKIEHFTQMVSELLESGKTMFKEMSNEFEERLIMLHKEQMEKWNEEIKELKMIDVSNEEASVVLHNTCFRNLPLTLEGFVPHWNLEKCVCREVSGVSVSQQVSV